MIDIRNLSDLSQYANFETYSFGDKLIILYDDHRCILTVLFEAYKLGIINDMTNLVTFDRHDDAKPIHPATKDILKAFVKLDLSEISSRDFKSFVEFDISEYDDDWVKIGMEMGIINNIINIGCEENFNIRDWRGNSYESKSGKKHLGFVIGHLGSELNTHGGRIGDQVLHEYDPIRKILGYSQHGLFPSIDDTSNFVLDFDLDCFTTTCMDKRFAWPEDVFRKEYYGDSASGYLMHLLIQKSKFITICREPSYCGGIGEANKILGYLDHYLFRGCLGAQAIS